MPELLKRIISGIILIALMVFCILQSSLTFLFLFFTIQSLCQYEFYALSKKCGLGPYRLQGIITASLLFLCSALHSSGKSGILIYFIFIPSVYLLFARILSDKNANSFSALGSTLLGIFYTAVPFASLNYLVFNPSGIYFYEILIRFMLLVWTYDSMAYICGKLFGKTKLSERISPHKTWEGLAGGAIFCFSISVLLTYLLDQNSFFHWTIISLIIIITGTCGDLFKSLLKRQAGVKDSGKIIPGHGGALDRFDSILFSAPFVLIYKTLFMS